MLETYIRICSFEDVRTLADLATAQPFRVWVSDGSQTVDAKSLMCMFSLDLCKPLALRLDCGEEGSEVFREIRERFDT